MKHSRHLVTLRSEEIVFQFENGDQLKIQMMPFSNEISILKVNNGTGRLQIFPEHGNRVLIK